MANSTNSAGAEGHFAAVSRKGEKGKVSLDKPFGKSYDGRRLEESNLLNTLRVRVS